MNAVFKKLTLVVFLICEVVGEWHQIPGHDEEFYLGNEAVTAKHSLEEAKAACKAKDPNAILPTLWQQPVIHFLNEFLINNIPNCKCK